MNVMETKKYYVSVDEYNDLGDHLDEYRKKSGITTCYSVVDRWLRINAGISALSPNAVDNKYPFEIINECKLTVFLLKYL